MEGRGVFFDGRSTRPHGVVTLLSVDALVLQNDSCAVLATWPLTSIRLVERETRDSPGLFTLDAAPDVRLAMDDEALSAALAARVKRQRQRLSLPTRILTGVAAGLVAFAMTAIFLPPVTAFLGRLIPLETEHTVGRYIKDSLVENIPRCVEPKGQAALEALVARLAEKANAPHPLHVEVREIDLLNAFAAPGGQIVLIQGVIKGAMTPEEVAGVLAHEIAHVMHRDPADQMVRVVGLSFLSEIFGSGGALAFLGLGFSYSREIERRADRGGMALLTEAGVPLRGLLTFFSRVSQEEKKIAPFLRGYLSTHPLTEARMDVVRIASVSDPHMKAEPVLALAEWQALRGICSQTAAKTSR